MKLISWNVNGLRSAMNKGLLPWIQTARPDILCLQEIKLSHDRVSLNAAFAQHFDESYCECAHKPGYSGVATLVKSNATSSKQVNCAISNLAVFTAEGRVLVTEHKGFLLYNLYFPSGTTGEARQSVKYTFLNHFLAHIDQLSARNRNRLIVCGDFNICHRDIDIHHPREAERRKLSGFLPEERAWMDEFAARGFVDTFRAVHPHQAQSYSWWTYRAGARSKNLGWRIDYFFIAGKLLPKLRDAGIYSTVGGSDHCPIYITLDANSSASKGRR